MRAATALGEIGNKDAVPHLIKLLPTCDSILRRFVVEALGNIGDKRATEALIPLLNDNDSTIRWNTALALGRIKDSKAIEALKIAVKDKNTWVQKDVAIALGRLGDEEGFRLLIELLRTTHIDGWRWEIINVLGEIGNKQAIDPLKEQLEIKREGLGLITTALTALSLAKLGNQDGYDEAIECLKNNEPMIKIPAIRALGEIGNKSAIGLLTKLLDDVNIEIRTEARAALNKIKGIE